MTKLQRVQRLGIGLAFYGVFIAGCAKETVTGPRNERSHRSVSMPSPGIKFDTVSLDDDLVAIDQLSPGFGGMYLDSAGTLFIVHKRANALSEAVGAIRQVMGDVPQLHAPRIALREGRFGFSSLVSYRAATEQALDPSDLVWSDLDEVNNRVSFGVLGNAAAQRITAAAIAAHVPAEAVAAIMTPPVRPTSTLLDRQDTLSGGLQLAFNTGYPTCTLGYLATRWGTARYMMTAGHCTPQMGTVDTSFWAANVFTNVRHAQEFEDPAYLYLYWPNCGRAALCRNSDAAQFFWIDTSQTYGLGLIATPAHMDTTWGSYTYPLTIYTHFNIVGEAPDSWLIPGAQVSKIGVTSGFTGGRISESCVTVTGFPVQGENVLCMAKTTAPAEPGDSGGPWMFGWPTAVAPPGVSAATLAGITSLAVPGLYSFFSTIGGITRDFGSMRTYPGKPCC